MLLISDARGDIGPFQLAIALTIVCLVLILFWEENTGDHTDAAASVAATKTGTNLKQPSFIESVMMSLSIIRKNPAILLLGLSQAFFEGAVFSFGMYLLFRHWYLCY